MATIRQIAHELGVSISTVSAVLDKRGYVSAPMRARIEKALRDADYQPDEIARSLRRRETRTIGLIVPDLGNGFYASLDARGHGLSLFCGLPFDRGRIARGLAETE